MALLPLCRYDSIIVAKAPADQKVALATFSDYKSKIGPQVNFHKSPNSTPRQSRYGPLQPNPTLTLHYFFRIPSKAVAGISAHGSTITPNVPANRRTARAVCFKSLLKIGSQVSFFLKPNISKKATISYASMSSRYEEMANVCHRGAAALAYSAIPSSFGAISKLLSLHNTTITVIFNRGRRTMECFTPPQTLVICGKAGLNRSRAEMAVRS
jgi:hypothetical protein